MADHTFNTQTAKRIARATLAVENAGIGLPRSGAKQPVVIPRTYLRGTINSSVSAGGSVSLTAYSGASAVSPTETITVYHETGQATIPSGTFVECALEISSGRYYIIPPGARYYSWIVFELDSALTQSDEYVEATVIARYDGERGVAVSDTVRVYNRAGGTMGIYGGSYKWYADDGSRGIALLRDGASEPAQYQIVEIDCPSSEGG